jgi:mannose-6-phosphate isomerase-like protein (cupin superfamily)
MNTTEVLTAWRARGFHGGVWVDPPGQVWEDFVHDEDELFMVVEGRVELELAGRRLAPAPGDEVLIPAGALHSVRNLGTTTARWLYAYRRG